MLAILRTLIHLSGQLMIPLVIIPLMKGLGKLISRLFWMKIRAIFNSAQDIRSYRTVENEADRLEVLLGDLEEIIIRQREGAGLGKKVWLRLNYIVQVSRTLTSYYLDDLKIFCRYFLLAVELSETNRQKGFKNNDTQLLLSKLARKHPYIKITSLGIVSTWNLNAETIFKPRLPIMLGTDSIVKIIPDYSEDGENLELLINKLCLNPNKYRLHINENIVCCGQRSFRLWINILEMDNLDQVIHCVSLPVMYPKTTKLYVRLYCWLARLY
ncbi:MAG: hypothetical protein AAFY63_22030 [Cyanobacteria bacterium J06643_13]